MKCKLCKRDLPQEKFYPKRKQCTECHGLRTMSWQEKNQEKCRSYAEKYAKKVKSLIELGKMYQEMAANGSNLAQVERSE